MTFTKDTSSGLWKSTDCGTSGTLQVQLKKQGIITVNTGLTDQDTVMVDRYVGDNMLRKVDLPEACLVTVITNVEPSKYSFVEE